MIFYNATLEMVLCFPHIPIGLCYLNDENKKKEGNLVWAIKPISSSWTLF